MNEAVLCECQHEFFKVRCIYDVRGYNRVMLRMRWLRSTQPALSITLVYAT